MNRNEILSLIEVLLSILSLWIACCWEKVSGADENLFSVCRARAIYKRPTRYQPRATPWVNNGVDCAYRGNSNMTSIRLLPRQGDNWFILFPKVLPWADCFWPCRPFSFVQHNIDL